MPSGNWLKPRYMAFFWLGAILPRYSELLGLDSISPIEKLTIASTMIQT